MTNPKSPQRRETRRSFLHDALGSAAAMVVLGRIPDPVMDRFVPFDSSSGSTDASDSGFWEKIRSQFSMPRGQAYMNTGTLGPVPKPVLEVLFEHYRSLSADPGTEYRRQYQPSVDVRAKAASFVGAEPGEIALMHGATHGLGYVISGLDLSAGDEVLLSFHEHPSALQPWKVKAQRDGIVLREVAFPIPARDPSEILSAFDDAITPRTRVISMSHMTYQTGTMIPVRELASLARSKGIITVVDGAHVLGMLPLDLHDLGADVYVMSGHKWLNAPAGTGMLYVRREMQDRIWPTVVTGGWDSAQAGAQRFEWLSQPAYPLLLAIGAAIDFQNGIGRERIEQRVRELTALLRSRLGPLGGITMYTPAHPALSGGIVGFKFGDFLNRDVVRTLFERNRIRVRSTNHGLNTVRVSTHYYNSETEVDRLVDALAEVVQRGVLPTP